MIHGHIDFVSRTRVAGWIHCHRLALAGMRLIAFIDDDPVGAGGIDVYREDLVRAGIGDGLNGFDFSIQANASHDLRVLNVRLEGGNALIRQADTCLVACEERPTVNRRQPLRAGTLSFLLGRGWLSQDQFGILERMGQFGACLQGLAQSRPGVLVTVEELAAIGSELLPLQMQSQVSCNVRNDIWGEHLKELHRELIVDFPHAAPVVGLWAPWTNCLNIAEGSHLGLRREETATGIDYEFGGDRLLWINLDTNFSIPTGGFTSPSIALLPGR